MEISSWVSTMGQGTRCQSTGGQGYSGIGRWSRVEESGFYRDHASLIGQPDQLGYGSRSHLLHDPTSMHLDRLLTDAKVSGNLLVQPPGDDEREDLSLPRSQGLDGAGDIAVTREEDDGDPVLRARECLLQLQPGKARHSHVEEQAAGILR